MPCSSTLEEALCVYKSTRFIRVRNYRLSLVYYTCLLLVLIYIVGYTVLYDKGYQATDNVEGTTSAKIKGTGSVGSVVLDAMDLVVPAIEENAFFVTTSMILTRNQSQGTCPGNSDVAPCNGSNYLDVCAQGVYNAKSQGMYTGNCCSDTLPNQGGCPFANERCEVQSWCPLESDSKAAQQTVSNVGSFTAFVKVDIEFTRWHESQTNTLDTNGDGSPVLGYNLFSLDDIIREATDGSIGNVSHDIAKYGAVVLAISNWNCNLDLDIGECQPHWQFYRIDSAPNTITQGFNYRDVHYDSSMQTRLLRKLYGVRVVFATAGVGGKFQFSQLTITFGAGLAYLGVAAFLTDIFLERFLPQSKIYGKWKNKDDHHINLRQVQDETDDNYHDLSSRTEHD